MALSRLGDTFDIDGVDLQTMESISIYGIPFGMEESADRCRVKFGILGSIIRYLSLVSSANGNIVFCSGDNE